VRPHLALCLWVLVDLIGEPCSAYGTDCLRREAETALGAFPPHKPMGAQ
jgi:hypothetical protein